MNYAIYTLGCKVNIFESESVATSLNEHGYKRVDADEYADIYIINTCTVTNKSDSKSRKVIRSCIRKNPNAIVVVMGCYAQLSRDEISVIDGVDIILGNEEKSNVVEIIEQYKKTNQQIVAVSDIMKSKVMSDLATDNFFENTRAFLKIQDGCNNFCSFCIIPFARGLMRSKPKAQVLQEVRELIANGYKEIVLTGIHTGGYGVDLEDYNITDLITDILDVEGLLRLRISSIEINQIDERLIVLMNNNEKLANHLHIPIQSGSDKVLKSMKRNYALNEFIEQIAYIKSKVHNISITTDIIVGYPQESDADFNESVETCKRVGFSELHVFPYSKRNGTPAAKMQQVDERVKKARVKALLALSDELKESYYLKQLGYIDTIIIEKIANGFAFGKTANYLDVQINDNNYCVGEALQIKVVEVDGDVCKGELYE